MDTRDRARADALLRKRAVELREALARSNPRDLVVAPDVLAPMSALEPVLRISRTRAEDSEAPERKYVPVEPQRERARSLRPTIVFSSSTQFGDTYDVSHLRLRDLPDDASEKMVSSPDATVRLTRSGIQVRIDGETLSPPERCGSNAEQFCLHAGETNIDRREDGLRGALESDSPDPAKQLYALVAAYPYEEVRAALADAIDDAPRNFVQIDIAPDVPAAAVPSLIHAVVYRTHSPEPRSMT